MYESNDLNAVRVSTGYNLESVVLGVHSCNASPGLLSFRNETNGQLYPISHRSRLLSDPQLLRFPVVFSC